MRNRGLLTELLGRPARESLWMRLAGWLVRVRAEMTVLATLVSADVLLIAYTGLPAQMCGLIEFGAAGTVLMEPHGRRYLFHRMWAVSSRHRIGACLVQTRTMTPDGRLPYLVWARPCSIGERIHAWLPAGLSVGDLDSITEALAAACYAAEARVEVNPKWTHLAVITIVRRDPLTGKKIIRPRYGRSVPSTGSDGAFTPLPDRDLVPHPTPPVQHPTVVGVHQAARSRPTPAAAGKAGATAKKGTHPADNDPAPPTVRGVGGVDVSDYV